MEVALWVCGFALDEKRRDSYEERERREEEKSDTERERERE